MFMNFTRSALFSIVAIHRRKCNRLQCFHLKVPLEFLDNSILHTKVKKFMIIAKIRARGVPRVLRCEGYKGLLHRGLYTMFSLSDNNY
jgi:AAA15 family ATPase/GTPase